MLYLAQPTETGFVLKRSADDVNFTNLVTSWQMSHLYGHYAGLDGRYSYRVYAFNGGGNSPMSNVAVVTTPPTTPTSLAAVYHAGTPQSAAAVLDGQLGHGSQRIGAAPA